LEREAYRSASSLFSAAEKRGKTDTSETRGDVTLPSATLDTGEINLKVKGSSVMRL
jgi:hypothetical protein